MARADARGTRSESGHTHWSSAAGARSELSESGDAVYGVSTGFGALSTDIERARSSDLQTRSIRSHAAAVGRPVEREVVARQ